MIEKKRALIIFAPVVTLSLIWIFWLAKFIAESAIIAWDEAGYLLSGFRIYKSLITADWVGFWQNTRSQFYYPFFQSWLLGGAGLLFGFDLIKLRIVGLLSLLFSAVLIFLLADNLGSLRSNLWRGWTSLGLVGLLASLIFLTSPAILFFHSIAMRERIGLLLTLLSLLIYLSAREKRQYRFFLLTGLILITLFFHKYNYALLVVLAFGLEQLISGWLNRKIASKRYWLENVALFQESRKPWPFRPRMKAESGSDNEPLERKNCFLPIGKNRGLLAIGSLFFPLALIASWWIFYPENKLSWFLSILENKWDRSQGLSFFAKIFYYPQEILFSYSVSPILAVLLAGGFIYSCFKFWRSYKVRVLALLFLINFLLAEIHTSNLQARFIFTTIPAFFILGSFGLVKMIPRLLDKIKQKSFFIGLSLPFLLVGGGSLFVSLIRLPGMIKPTATHLMCSPIFYQTDYRLGVPYDFWQKNWPRQYQEGEKIEDVMRFILKNIDYRQPVTLVGQLNELSPNLFDLYLEMTRFTNQSIRRSDYQRAAVPPRRDSGDVRQYWVVVEVKPESIFNTEDYQLANKFLEPQVQATKNDLSLTKIISKDFVDLGLVVTILAK